MIVLDTSVASELMRPAPSPVVVTWLKAQRAADLRATSITVAEILYGVGRLPRGRRRDALTTAAAEVFTAFEARVLAFDHAAAVFYARIVSARERTGLPIGGFDAQIAAICLVHGAPLATRNVKDFELTGITVVDPWSD